MTLEQRLRSTSPLTRSTRQEALKWAGEIQTLPKEGFLMAETFETIIIGAGQGGLSTSYYLKQQGRDHILLEQAPHAASAWRKRWDSFTLITPNWTIQLPGAAYQGDEPDAFMSRDDLINYFEAYIERFELPVRYGIKVMSVQPFGSGYRLSTDKGAFEAHNVVIATGLYQQPKIPPYSKKVSPAILQMHSSQYRNPASLPPGGVLVVGSAQSGCQIAEELYQAGRKVYLSVSGAGRFPRRYRGQDITRWFEAMGLSDRTIDDLPSPQARYAPSPHGTGKDGGHTINLHQFARDGVQLLGRIRNASGNRIELASDLMENLAKADKFEAELVKSIDKYIAAHELDDPLEALPQLRDGYDAPERTELDLKSAGIVCIIWATGYKFDFSLVPLDVFDEDGFPLQDRGVSNVPGLYFIGLPLLHTTKSGLLSGVGEDAAAIIEHLVERPV